MDAKSNRVFHGYTVTRFEWSHYAKPANVSLQLWCSAGPLCTASVNTPILLPEGLVAIKDYSENEGMLAFLVGLGLVEDTGQRLHSGFISIPVCRILKRE